MIWALAWVLASILAWVLASILAWALVWALAWDISTSSAARRHPATLAHSLLAYQHLERQLGLREPRAERPPLARPVGSQLELVEEAAVLEPSEHFMVGEGALHLVVHVHVVPLQLAQLESRPLAGPTLLYSISLGEKGSPGADAWNESGTFCMDGKDGMGGMDCIGCMG